MKEKNLKLLVMPGIIGPIFYFVLLTILGLMWPGYNPVSTGMSEIGAVDSPFKNIMNYLGFSLLGLFIISVSLGFRSYFQKTLQMTMSFILLFLGGVSMFVVGFLPCDPSCIDVTLTGQLHSWASTIPAILIPLAAMLAAYPISKQWGEKWGYISFYLGILSMSAGPLMFIGALSDYTGLIQRLGIGFSLFWLMILSTRIYRGAPA